LLMLLFYAWLEFFPSFWRLAVNKIYVTFKRIISNLPFQMPFWHLMRELNYINFRKHLYLHNKKFDFNVLQNMRCFTMNAVFFAKDSKPHSTLLNYA
jgi:hypothetical protein